MICGYCKEDKEPFHPLSKYCSHRCRDLAIKKKNKEAWEQRNKPKFKICEECKEPFQVTTVNERRKKYCSDDCKKKHEKERRQRERESLKKNDSIIQDDGHIDPYYLTRWGGDGKDMDISKISLTKGV